MARSDPRAVYVMIQMRREGYPNVRTDSGIEDLKIVFGHM